nr:MAG TPA: hypothetical protein [Caudoviricetes sp.]
MKEKREKEHDLTYLYAALGAVAFFVAGVPVLDAIGGWISNVFGLKSVKLNYETSKYATEEHQETHTQAVGFYTDDDCEDGCCEDE